MADATQNGSPTFETVSRVIELLSPLSEDDRKHVFRMIATWFCFDSLPTAAARDANSGPATTLPVGEVSQDDKFSDRPVLSVKDFIIEKDPITEVERLACLAYYLTHYQETPHFKTVDLSRLNTEAAQRKLSNPAVAAGNAVRDGFFVQAPRGGYRQLSAMGERFVQSLPDREAAQQVKQRMASRRGKRKSSRPESADSKPRNQEG